MHRGTLLRLGLKPPLIPARLLPQHLPRLAFHKRPVSNVAEVGGLAGEASRTRGGHMACGDALAGDPVKNGVLPARMLRDKLAALAEEECPARYRTAREMRL